METNNGLQNRIKKLRRDYKSMERFATGLIDTIKDKNNRIEELTQSYNQLFNTYKVNIEAYRGIVKAKDVIIEYRDAKIQELTKV